MAARTTASGLPDVVLVRGSLDHPDADDYLLGSAEALILPVLPGDGPTRVALDPATAAAAQRYGLDLLELAQRLRLKGAAAETAVTTLPRVLPSQASPSWAGLPERLVLAGVGAGSPTELRRAGAALGRSCDGLREAVVALPVGPTPDAVESLRALVEGFLLAAYRPPRAGLAEGPPPALTRLVVVVTESAEGDLGAAVEAARRAARVTWTVRRLGATPSNVKSPAWFAEQAAQVVRTAPDTSIVVRDEAWLAEQRFGGLLAVGSGSAAGPRLVVVDYQPQASRGARHVVLVGKGITFDTGGLSIKNRDSMISMKTDMAGAAVALATVVGAAHAALPHRVTAVLPLAENAVGAASYRPGDVLSLHDGTTVEVLNTDAEGRLVLADALAWSGATLTPDLLVDVATLTGAASLGLGRRHAALYATDETLAHGLAAAGESTGERTWRMPLVADYEAALDSAIADVANVATDPYVRGGSITAALFLRRFTHGLPWAHLDVAGPARAPKTEHEVTEGASGFGARLLLRWLEDLPAG